MAVAEGMVRTAAEACAIFGSRGSGEIGEPYICLNQTVWNPEWCISILWKHTSTPSSGSQKAIQSLLFFVVVVVVVGRFFPFTIVFVCVCVFDNQGISRKQKCPLSLN